MKICIVTHKLSRTDGQGKVNYEVVVELLKRGDSVTLVASEVCPKLLEQNNIEWILIPVNSIPTMLLRNLKFSRKSSFWLNKNSVRFDIILVNGAIVAERSDVNAVHFVHSSWIRSSAHPLRQKISFYSLYQGLYSYINSYWEKKAFKKTKILIAVSEQVKYDLCSIGVPEEKIRVIHNGVDLETFRPGKESRTTLGLPTSVLLGLFVGDIRSNRKNLDTVLKALVELPNVHLAVVGDYSRSPYPLLSNQLGISDRIHFMGFREDVSKIMRAVDCFIFPSRYEACTLVLLEAMASGLPVITASSTGGCELVSEKCGYILNDPEDSVDLSNSIQKLFTNPESILRMGQESRLIAERLSWSITGQAYVEIFREIEMTNSRLKCITRSKPPWDSVRP